MWRNPAVGSTAPSLITIDQQPRICAVNACTSRDLRDSRSLANRALRPRSLKSQTRRPGETCGSGLPGEVLGVPLGVARPLRGKLVFREAGVDGTSLDAGIAVDALVGIDVEHLDRLVVGFVGGRVDAVNRTN